MAVLLNLKSEVEARTNATMRLSFSRATEAHLIAKEIGKPISSHALYSFIFSLELCESPKSLMHFFAGFV